MFVDYGGCELRYTETHVEVGGWNLGWGADGCRYRVWSADIDGC